MIKKPKAQLLSLLLLLVPFGWPTIQMGSDKKGTQFSLLFSSLREEFASLA